jgi:hypothetical protein
MVADPPDRGSAKSGIVESSQRQTIGEIPTRGKLEGGLKKTFAISKTHGSLKIHFARNISGS